MNQSPVPQSMIVKAQVSWLNQQPVGATMYCLAATSFVYPLQCTLTALNGDEATINITAPPFVTFHPKSKLQLTVSDPHGFTVVATGTITEAQIATIV